MALKALLDKNLVETIGQRLAAAHPNFDTKKFTKAATNGLNALELKARASLIADAMAAHLPSDFAVAKPIFVACLGPVAAEEAPWGGSKDSGANDEATAAAASANEEADEDDAQSANTLTFMPHSAYLERVAKDPKANFDDVLSANLELTQRFTAEFSMRPLIERDPERAIAALTSLTTHQSRHVRRMVSECTRPRLPWGGVLHLTKKDPRVSVPLLQALKWDPSLYVRRSVANHVGDILKDNRAVGVELCKEWTAMAKSKTHVKQELARREKLSVGGLLGSEPAKGVGKKRAAAADPVAATQEELLWVVRHALRLPDKKGEAWASKLRNAARL